MSYIRQKSMITNYLHLLAPQTLQMCGTSAPADLFDELIATTFGGALTQFSERGVDQPIPQQCTNLRDRNKANGKG